MADGSTIEWLAVPGTKPATWNPVRGCTRQSEGCRNCYAEVLAARFSDPGQWGHGLARRVELPGGGIDHRWTGRVEPVESQLVLPLRWRSPRSIFVNSTSDLFHEALPDEVIDRVFAVMALCPQHTFFVLTKRADRMRRYLCDLDVTPRIRGWMEGHEKHCGPLAHFPHIGRDGRWPLPNVWLGVSCEDQQRADERIPDLLATPAAVRWVSGEPLIGAVDFERITVRVPGEPAGFHHYLNALTGEVYDDENGTIDGAYGDDPAPRLDWIVAGGESGPGARPMHPDWARGIRDQCEAAGVPYFFKQHGAWAPLDGGDGEWPTDGASMIRLLPNGERGGAGWPMQRVGKAVAGRLLDGRTWDQMPEARHG